MSHQVIITFDIDENVVQENAEKEAGRQISKIIVDKAFGSSYYAETKLKQYVQDVLKEMLSENRQEIIDAAIAEVVKTLSKTKAVKEKLVEALDGKEGS